MSALLDLARRCEEATGPGRELDGKIWIACLADAASRKAYIDGLAISQSEADWRLDYMMGGYKPTASLDAAMTLVPEGHKWAVTQQDSEKPTWQWWGELRRGHWTSYDKAFPARAATAALALCAAALSARAAQCGRSPTGPGRETGPVHEHTVGEADAPNPSLSSQGS